jgi:SRSO17 transposase
MQEELTPDAERRLVAYIDQIGNVLGDARRRASFVTYALGLLTEGERKSVEPIAARACADPGEVDAVHQRLLHFLSNSEWSDDAVRLAAARYALAAITAHDPIETWIVDDTGFLKQGKHSVGVQRQYTGSAGKITNCQIAVSLSIGTKHVHAPVDFDLYLPRSWLDDPARRREARIPDTVRFRTKIEIAKEMIKRALDADVPRGVVLADSAYGDSVNFRAFLRQRGLHFALAVSRSIKVWRAGSSKGRRRASFWVGEIAERRATKSFERIAWREGTKGELSSRFAFERVVPCRSAGRNSPSREPVWLVMEWENGEERPTKYFFVSLPETVTRQELVRVIKQRWATERIYEDLKGELGLDHFEGRRFRGWHHHVSTVLCCAAFVTAERCRAFSPSIENETGGGSNDLAA